MGGTVQVVAIRGGLGVSDAQRLERALEDGGPSQVVNVDDLEFLCGSAFGALVRSRRRLAELGGDLVLSGSSTWLDNVLEVMKLQDEFQTFQTDVEALRHLCEGCVGVVVNRVTVGPGSG